MKLKDSVGTGTNGDKLDKNQLKLAMRRRFLPVTEGKFWSNVPVPVGAVGGKHPS